MNTNSDEDKIGDVIGVFQKNKGEIIVVSDGEAFVNDNTVPKVLFSLVNTFNPDRNYRFAIDPSKLHEMILLLEKAQKHYSGS